jgi:hypothetical protein
MTQPDAPKPAPAVPQRPVKVPPSKIPPPRNDLVNKGFGSTPPKPRKPTVPGKPD